MNARNDHNGHHIQRIRVHAVANKVAMQHHGRGDGGKPQQQAEGAKVDRSKIDEGVHRPRCLKYSDRGRARRRKGQFPSGGTRHDAGCCATLNGMSTSTPVFPPASQMDILFSTDQIAARVAEIGEAITKDYAGQDTGQPIVLIGVLKGAAIFLADLARAIQVDNTFDFVAVSSYGRARVSSGAVKLIKDIDNPIEGRHVILVEDILDTGLTLSYLRGLMLQHKPKSLKIATCLDKPERRLVPIEADYVGFHIPNQFVIGYGMDYAEVYRNVADIRLFPNDAGH